MSEILRKCLKECFFSKVAGPQSETLSKDELHYKYFSIDLFAFQEQLLSKENFKEKSKNFEMQCILCYSRCMTLHFQLLQLVRLTDP